MQSSQPLTQQQEVEIIIKEMITAGRPLYKCDCRNELALRMWARHIPKLSAKFYEDKTFGDRANSWISIEYAGRYGRHLLETSDNDMAKARLDVIDENLYRMMTKDQRLVVDELRKAKARNIPLKDYINGSTFVLRIWRVQDPDFDRFLKENEDVEWEIIGLAKPASVTRYTRFIKEANEKKYSPTLTQFNEGNNNQ